ncbi:MAG: hypothetical protein QM661_07240 [Solimonas sp.]
MAPMIHSSVPPNALHIVVPETGLNILGFRMPAFIGPDANRLRRLTWEWLLEASDYLRDKPAVIAGDFNTAVGDRSSKCGDCFGLLEQRGWVHARPESGCSWRHNGGSERSIDHAFLTPALAGWHSEYSWSFRDRSPEAAMSKVGVPDHAMLIVTTD